MNIVIGILIGLGILLSIYGVYLVICLCLILSQLGRLRKIKDELVQIKKEGDV